MDVREQTALCSYHYGKWKDMAMSSEDSSSSRKFMGRAFFWVELQAAFVALWAIEQTARDKKTRDKILVAKANLSKKLADYADSIIGDMQ
jgi:hypothetical protein